MSESARLTRQASTKPRPRWPRSVEDYRAYWTIESTPGWRDVCIQQFSAWLEEKKIQAGDISTGEIHMGDKDSTFALDVVHRSRTNGSLMFLQLVESNASGVWSVEALVEGDATSGWISLVVTGPPGITAAVPRVVRHLVTALPLRDGILQFNNLPVAIGVNDLDPFIDLICDQDRRSVVFVAGTSDPNSYAQMWRYLCSVTQESLGLAKFVILSPDATAQMQLDWGPAHDPKPDAIRTYFPGLDPADPLDVTRNRILGTSRIGPGSEVFVRHFLGQIARAQASATPPPGEVTAARRDIQRMFVPENSAELDRLERLEQTEDELAMFLDELDSTRALLADSEAALDRARSEISALRDVVLQAGASLEDTEGLGTAFPSTYQELLKRMREMEPLIYFTGDEDALLSLETKDPGSILASIWRCWCALADYSRARSEGKHKGGFLPYLKNTPDGFATVPLKRHALKESHTTMQRFGSERLFPVPKQVDPAGNSYMQAHLKIDGYSTVAPRMYYLDRTADLKAVYVGYIGQHLTNTKTS